MKSRLLGVVYIFLLIFGISTTAGASLIVPVGLNVGDKYHVIFVSSTTAPNATSGSITDYDAVVQAVANTASIGTTIGLNGWLAVGSTQSVSAKSHLQPLFGSSTNVPIYNQHGDLISTTFDGLWDGSLDNPVLFDEFGVSQGSKSVWTGTLPDGSTSGRPLGDAIAAATGAANQTDSTWINNSTAAVGATFIRLYGLSEEITVTEVASVPIPAAIWLFGSGLLGLIGVARRKKAT